MCPAKDVLRDESGSIWILFFPTVDASQLSRVTRSTQSAPPPIQSLQLEKKFYTRLRDQFENRDTFSERHLIENKNEISETNVFHV